MDIKNFTLFVGIIIGLAIGLFIGVFYGFGLIHSDCVTVHSTHIWNRNFECHEVKS